MDPALAVPDAPPSADTIERDQPRYEVIRGGPRARWVVEYSRRRVRPNDPKSPFFWDEFPGLRPRPPTHLKKVPKVKRSEVK